MVSADLKFVGVILRENIALPVPPFEKDIIRIRGRKRSRDLPGIVAIQQVFYRARSRRFDAGINHPEWIQEFHTWGFGRVEQSAPINNAPLDFASFLWQELCIKRPIRQGPELLPLKTAGRVDQFQLELLMSHWGGSIATQEEFLLLALSSRPCFQDDLPLDIGRHGRENLISDSADRDAAVSRRVKESL